MIRGMRVEFAECTTKTNGSRGFDKVVASCDRDFAVLGIIGGGDVESGIGCGGC